MSFFIQVGNPQIKPPAKTIVADLSEAVEAIFPLDTERAIIAWNHVLIPLNYGYDLSVMIDDLLPLIQSLLSGSQGCERVHWGSSSFNAEWFLEHSGGQLTISSTWHAVSGGYGLERILNSRSKLEISVQDFLSE